MAERSVGDGNVSPDLLAMSTRPSTHRPSIAKLDVVDSTPAFMRTRLCQKGSLRTELLISAHLISAWHMRILRSSGGKFPPSMSDLKRTMNFQWTLISVDNMVSQRSLRKVVPDPGRSRRGPRAS
jgi:hypothetical protein